LRFREKIRSEGSLCIYYLVVAFLKVGNESVDERFKNWTCPFNLRKKVTVTGFSCIVHREEDVRKAHSLLCTIHNSHVSM
jgi:hypothetical protein